MGKTDRKLVAKSKREKRKQKKQQQAELEERLKNRASSAAAKAAEAIAQREKAESVSTKQALEIRRLKAEIIDVKEALFNKSVELENALLEIDITRGYLDEARNRGDRVEAKLEMANEKIEKLRKELHLYKTNPPPPDSINSAFRAFNKLRKIGLDNTDEGKEKARSLTDRVVRWLEEHEKAFRAQT